MKSLKSSVISLVVLALALTGQALAALPTPVPPSTAPATGDWLGLIKGYIKDGGLVLGLAISVIGFLWVSYTAIAKFNEARNGRAEWAEVGLLGVVAAGVLVFIGFLLNQAATVI
jgi:integrating conjugative element membrane protein (TIGR03745 family)